MHQKTYTEELTSKTLTRTHGNGMTLDFTTWIQQEKKGNKRKVDKMDLDKVGNFCALKGTIKKVR
jgi:hypothetical protein